MEQEMRDFSMGPLFDGGRVVVIGGGPGGTATAIALQRRANALKRNVHVTIVEGKQFRVGQHFNQCSGVLAPPIVDLIERDLGVPFPHQLCQRIITGYILHTALRSIVLDSDTQPLVALRRIEFDAYMLDAARQCGVEVLPARLTNLEFYSDRVQIYTESKPLEADVVVGAFGLDEGTAVIFERTVGYRPPPALSAIVTKYHPGEASMQAYGNRIHAFLPASPRIEFGAVTPKSNHLTINIAGTRVDGNLMHAFIAAQEVRQVLPCLENARHSNINDLLFFKGRFPCGLAKNFTGDRYVMVGDAAGLVRAFKGKGVTSAILTGLRAAEVILHRGISAEAFQAYRTANHDITGDLFYGHTMRRLTILASRLGLMDAVLQSAGHNPILQQALFDAVSAQRPYREVIRAAFSPASVRSIVKAFLGHSASV
jgi:flavin-dependent dehydrogenase